MNTKMLFLFFLLCTLKSNAMEVVATQHPAPFAERDKQALDVELIAELLSCGDDVERITHLLKQGADPNIGGDLTVLMFAAAHGYSNVCKLLLQAGANPEIKKSTGHTAADIARCNKHAELAALLSDPEQIRAIKNSADNPFAQCN